ncbi:bifunctional non-homologous end joining protein LigD [Pedobacter sp. UYP30]|uniref:DNA ligase D n=1 Tax=Pedobacter sp. UYP30 TaxID=1756400 RepID=UPI00339B6F2E
MSLKKYLEKRDFSKTTEPKSGAGKGKKLEFVVQRHHASRLHYDFRLELDGVLKSWAIPKGPSLNPKDKRLAMMVEDHPYNYRTFEGSIPTGNYGAGTVTIFDAGNYTPIDDGSIKELKNGLKDGNLKFRLQGKILKGEFALVKLKNGKEDNAWLLIKHNDEFAVHKDFDVEDLVDAQVKKQGLDFKKDKKKTSNPTSRKADEKKKPLAKTQGIEESYFKPMLAKLAAGPVIEDDDWLFEKKYDGYRAVVSKQNEHTLIKSRNGMDYTEKFAPVARALEKLDEDAVLDGEVVIEDEKGNSIFQELQNYDPKTSKSSLKYYVFDLLNLNANDLRNFTLLQRKELLKKVLGKLNGDVICYSEHVLKNGEKLLATAKKNGWEGIMAKRIASTYINGSRTDLWRKYKIIQSQEAIIIGFTKPTGSRNYFGALVLAVNKDNELIYAGNCGTGFNEETLKALHGKLSPLTTKIKPIAEKVNKESSVTWVTPTLVCEVNFTEWTMDEHLRHPVFKGLRMDKSPQEVVIEEEKPTSAVKVENMKKQQEIQKRPEEETLTFGKKKVVLSNQNKVFWPKEHITKGDLLEYYKAISPYILPHLKDKPLSLNRHPNGINGASFFQKDMEVDKIPSWIKTAPLHSESNDKQIDYLICNDEATLLWMVNLGCIEINPWLSTYKLLEQPQYAVLDLDPHDIDFEETIAVAKTTKNILDKMGIEAFIKTSGSKGLHIFIPIGKNYDYELSKNFIFYLGNLVHTEHPDTTSLERSPAKRKNKIYLDYLQNRHGQTIAAAYSARPKPGATVSMPLNWEEVKSGLKIADFTILNALERLNAIGDPWKDIHKVRNNLKTALEKLKKDD